MKTWVVTLPLGIGFALGSLAFLVVGHRWLMLSVWAAIALVMLFASVVSHAEGT